MDSVIATVRDSNLKLMLSFGIGLHHAGLHERDRKTVEELFVNQKIQVRLLLAYNGFRCKSYYSYNPFIGWLHKNVLYRPGGKIQMTDILEQQYTSYPPIGQIIFDMFTTVSMSVATMLVYYL